MSEQGSDGGESATRRVWARLPEGTRAAIDRLSPADLQTLLLDVARQRASRVTPAEVLRRWRQDRFVRPSGADPRRLTTMEARLWELLPAGFDPVELSPVVPLGTCVAVAPVSQNRIVTTMRGAEVLSDSANALAVEAADRRSSQAPEEEVHLAVHHRLLRAQRFPAGWSSHFPLLTLVSSARDTGSAHTQARLLSLHLGYWQSVLRGLGGQVKLTIFNPAVRERIAASLLAASADAPIVEGPERAQWHGYYTDAAFILQATDGEQRVEVGDGGFTTWTAQLMGNAKERCLISCVSTERLLALRG